LENPEDIPVPSTPPSPPLPPFSMPEMTPQKTRRFTTAVLIGILLVGLVAGGLIGYTVTYIDFNNKLSNVQSQLGYYQGSGNQQTYVVNDSVSLSALYQHVKSSVIVIQDLVPQYSMFGQLIGYSIQQGSGFVVNANNQLVVITNNHVIDGASNITVTLSDGSSYSATLLGADAKADLAVLKTSSLPGGVTGLTLISSASLQVGDPVVAVGSPYGLSGTLTTGVISALGRTITESDNSRDGQTIADMIQTSTAINSGNSGGPLINYAGDVVGITTAGISNSQGLGFAIPSATIIRELNSLITTGSYNQHPSLDAVGTDMNLQIAQAMGISTTYGWLVEQISSNNGLQGGNVQKTIMGSQTIIGGDIIIGVNGQRITNTDDLLSYLEQHTLPGQTIGFTVIRGASTQTVQVTISTA
jgi:S1-C subfamily serine protease